MKAIDKLTVVEQEGQRVLATAQLTEFYGTDVNRIYDTFNRNKERYKEGKHHFCLEGETLQAFKHNHANCVVAQPFIFRFKYEVFKEILAKWEAMCSNG
mgnify:FL=1